MRLAYVYPLVATLALTPLVDAPAAACGCFLPPDPIQPLVQTGERILFRVDGDQVTAHIQIAFAGSDATQFGWTVPVPSIPTLEVGDDALFQALLDGTSGQYDLTVSNECAVGYARASGASGCGFPDLLHSHKANSGNPVAPSAMPVSPDIVVIRSTVGPYDFAVLKANDKTDLVTWLNLNRFFLPTASDEALKPYVGPGRYFLALKMRPGTKAGDIKPIVLHYASDLPMIPLTLTAATVAPKLPVTVWMLGNARAIPRNYHHVVLDDALLDWQDQLKNYDQVVAAAVAEAPAGHGFVTEFSGPSASVREHLPPSLQPLFDGAPTLTRLYSVLASTSLDRDPVFSTNPDLPPVARSHSATYHQSCGDGDLETAMGFHVPELDDTPQRPAGLPAAARIEILYEEGQPVVVTDNTARITELLSGRRPATPPDAGVSPGSDGGSGDGSIARRSVPAHLLAAALLPFAMVTRRRRRRTR